ARRQRRRRRGGGQAGRHRGVSPPARLRGGAGRRLLGPAGRAGGGMSTGKFKFRLASVLKVARLREDAQRAQLAIAAAGEVAAERRRLERVAAYEALPPAGAGSVADFQAGREIADLRARSVTDAEAARQEAAARLNAARDEWLRAARRVKSIEE